MVALASVAAAFAVAGVRLAGDLGRTDTTLAHTEHRGAQLRTELGTLDPLAATAGAQVRALDDAVSGTRSSVTAATGARNDEEERLVLAGLDVYSLDACLGGVTRALDQVAVGQTRAADTAMAGAAPWCHPAGSGG